MIEMLIIVGQEARRRRGHCNDDSPFDETLFTILGATIVVLSTRRGPAATVTP